MLTLTQKALEEFDNQHDFERMCADILNSLGYKDVTPIAPRGGGDGGRDVTFTTESGGKGLACASLRKDSNKKFEEDFFQRKAGEYEKYYYFTNSYLTAPKKLKFAKYCIEKLNAEFVTQDREALRSLLDGALKTIRKRYLGIDDDNSAQIKKHLTKILKYPATLANTNFGGRVSIAEGMLTRPVHREIYYYINEIDDEELVQIPSIGAILRDIKEHYYNFRLMLDVLTSKCKKVIGTQTQTSFQFIQGWVMYFEYFLLRSFGNSIKEIEYSLALNYGITYQECEQVFNLLSKTKGMSEEIRHISIQRKNIGKLTTKLIAEINKLNSK